MRRGFQRLLPVSPENEHAIPGWARTDVCQVIPERVGKHFLVGLLLPDPLAAMPGAHQSAALLHAMRLTSEKRSLQSP